MILSWMWMKNPCYIRDQKLQFFCGAFGIHDSILGYRKQGKQCTGEIVACYGSLLFERGGVTHGDYCRFPFDKLIKFYKLEQINDAARDSEAGTVLKPVLTFA